MQLGMALKGKMYQSVDQQDEIDNEHAHEISERRALLWKLLAGALIILVIVGLFGRPDKKPAAPADIAARAETATYNTAIAEPSAALRRARLQDFQTTYPESTRQSAVTAQLEALSQHETRAWAKVLDASYDPKLSSPEKRAVLQAYERAWGGSYLGGRESELASLRETLDSESTRPDRTLKEGPSPIPQNITDNVMVGGPRAVVPRPVQPRPQPVRPAPIAPVPKPRYVPEVTRNVTPRYPRRASQRGIEGVVELNLNIDARGRVRMTELMDVATDGGRYERDFIRAAERAAMRTRFKPYIVDGEAQPISGVVKLYRFKLDN